MCLGLLKWWMMMLCLCSVVVRLVLGWMVWWQNRKLVVEGSIWKFRVFRVWCRVLCFLMISFCLCWKKFLFLKVVLLVVIVSWFSGQELKLFLICFSFLINFGCFIVKLMCRFVSDWDLDRVWVISRLGCWFINVMVLLLLKFMQVLLIIIIDFGLVVSIVLMVFSGSSWLVGVLGLGKMMLLLGVLQFVGLMVSLLLSGIG